MTIKVELKLKLKFAKIKIKTSRFNSRKENLLCVDTFYNKINDKNEYLSSVSTCFQLLHIEEEREKENNSFQVKIQGRKRGEKTRLLRRVHAACGKSFGSLKRSRRKRTDPEAAGASKQTEVVERNLQESTKSNCTVKAGSLQRTDVPAVSTFVQKQRTRSVFLHFALPRALRYWHHTEPWKTNSRSIGKLHTHVRTN